MSDSVMPVSAVAFEHANLEMRGCGNTQPRNLPTGTAEI
jgi:hypothetical protein